MNSIQEINRINQRELDLGLSGNASWHHQYKDSAYVHVGGLSFEMTEGDVIAVFSQFGEIIDINMPRDKETSKPRGFAFLMYEDQRSTILAVDNMNGAVVLGRMLKVDHVHKYEQPGKRDEDGKYQKPEEPTYNAMPPELSGSESSSESESDPADDIDAEDPMAAYLRQEKKKIKGKSRDKADEKEEKRRRKEERRRKREERELRRMRKGEGVKRERREEGGGRNGLLREVDDRTERRSRDRSKSPYSRYKRLDREVEERRKERPESYGRERERPISRPRDGAGSKERNGSREEDERDRRRGYDDPRKREVWDDDRRRDYDRRDRDRR